MQDIFPELIAAVDLGSNSFHMIVARLRDGELHIVDRIKETVRLAAGLDDSLRLNQNVQVRAIQCLERFGERLRDLPDSDVRVVGTNTLRRARNAREFLSQAERALGHPIEIISGIEEARLIYLGVERTLASDAVQRLVIDIGGGSTEMIIGAGRKPKRKESLHMGCVSMTARHFPDGKISAKRFKRAVLAAQQELEPFEWVFRHDGWDEAVGASGTFRAVRDLLAAEGWSHDGITSHGLEKLADAVLEYGHIDALKFASLDEKRAAVLPGGFAIIYAVFKTLDIDSMRVSSGALREGLLYDLLGRISDEDIRGKSVNALANRYHVDNDHAERVAATARACLKQTKLPRASDANAVMRLLEWAARLHEIGLDIAHSHYHKHGAYIIEHADLPGFSLQDQRILALLIGNQRRKFRRKYFEELGERWECVAVQLAVILRLAVIFHRSRQPGLLPRFALRFETNRLTLSLPKDWCDKHPLTVADLDQEVVYLRAAAFELSI